MNRSHWGFVTFVVLVMVGLALRELAQRSGVSDHDIGRAIRSFLLFLGFAATVATPALWRLPAARAGAVGASSGSHATTAN